jgi:chaperonin GroEL (HSP60 family)
MLEEEGVVCVEVLDRTDCDLIANCTDAPFINEVQQLEQITPGISSVHVIDAADMKMIKISNNNSGFTLVLRAPTETLLDECERNLCSSISVLLLALEHKRLIG